VFPCAYTSGALLVTVSNPQLSLVATGTPSTTPLAVHRPASVLTVTLAGQVIVGASWSSTVTTCAQVCRLPLVSTAVQVTVVFPCAYTSGALLVTVSNPQLSLVATGTPSTTPLAVHRPASVLTVTLAGHVIVGGVVSLTVIVVWQEEFVLWASSAT